MNEIICPHCGKAFKIDEAGYADILKQVRDHAFDEALQERLRLAEEEKRTAIELAEAKVTSKLEKEATKKEAEIAQLKAELKAAEVAKQRIPDRHPYPSDLLALFPHDFSAYVAP